MQIEIINFMNFHEINKFHEILCYRLQIENLQSQIATMQRNQYQAIRASSNQEDDNSWFSPLWRMMGYDTPHNPDFPPNSNEQERRENEGFIDDFPSNNNHQSPDGLRRRNLPYPVPDISYPSQSVSELPYPPTTPPPQSSSNIFQESNPTTAEPSIGKDSSANNQDTSQACDQA